MNFELKRKKFGRGIPNDILIDIRGVAVLAVIKELPLLFILSNERTLKNNSLQEASS